MQQEQLRRHQLANVRVIARWILPPFSDVRTCRNSRVGRCLLDLAQISLQFQSPFRNLFLFRFFLQAGLADCPSRNNDDHQASEQLRNEHLIRVHGSNLFFHHHYTPTTSTGQWLMVGRCRALLLTSLGGVLGVSKRPVDFRRSGEPSRTNLFSSLGLGLHR